MDLRSLIILHENLKLKPYPCSEGKITIGIGRNLTDKGITRKEAMYLFENDLKQALVECYSAFSFWKDLDEVRQAVLVDMCFNLGIGGLLEFKTTLGHIRLKQWKEAAEQMLKSKWAKQVKTRAVRLSKMMETGEWPNDSE